MIQIHEYYVTSTDNFAQALASNRSPCKYTLSPGATYLMDPCWATADWPAVVPAGTVINLNGARLKLRPDAAAMCSRPDARDLWGLTCGPNVRIQNGVIDANEQAFRNADPKKSWHSLGIWSPMGPLQCEDVWVENVRGLPETPTSISGLSVNAVEGFGFLLNGEGGGHVINGGGVRHCPEHAYISGINVGVVGDNPARSRVEYFTVDVSPKNWMGIGVNQCVDIVGFHLVGGCQRGVHNDTGVTDSVTVKRSQFKGLSYLLSLVSPGGVHRKRDVRFQKCTVAFAEGTAWLAELWDQSVAPTEPAITGDILFEEVLVGPRDMETWISMAVRSGLPVTFVDCKLPAKIKSTAGTWLSVFNSPTEVQ